MGFFVKKQILITLICLFLANYILFDDESIIWNNNLPIFIEFL